METWVNFDEKTLVYPGTVLRHKRLDEGRLFIVISVLKKSNNGLSAKIHEQGKLVTYEGLFYYNQYDVCFSKNVLNIKLKTKLVY